MTSRESAIVLAKALDSKKGMEIKVLKTEELTTLADYFVICTASSTTQIKALSDVCEEAMERNGERVHHIEGHRGGTWVLMDFSSVVVHIFMDEARKFYDLERLWGDAQEEDLSQVLKPGIRENDKTDKEAGALAHRPLRSKKENHREVGPLIEWEMGALRQSEGGRPPMSPWWTVRS